MCWIWVYVSREEVNAKCGVTYDWVLILFHLQLSLAFLFPFLRPSGFQKMVNADLGDGECVPASLQEVEAFFDKHLREEARLPATNDTEPESIVTRIQCERCVFSCAVCVCFFDKRTYVKHRLVTLVTETRQILYTGPKAGSHGKRKWTMTCTQHPPACITQSKNKI